MKQHLRQLLINKRLEEIVETAAQKKRTLGVLVSLTYDSDPLIAWRAVEAMGAATDRIAETNPEYIRNHLRRLHWLLSEESGGVCWYAPQAMAEILRRRPHEFPDYNRIVISLINTVAEEDLINFRPGILWAIGTLASVLPDEVEAVLPVVAACLDDPDSKARGMAVWCLKKSGRTDLFADRTDLLADNGPVDLYENGLFERTSVMALAQL